MSNIKKTCGKNTNCYETIDTIKQLFNKETEKDIKNLESLINILEHNNNSKIYLYRIDINITDLINNRKNIVFNHSFCIIQHGHHFIMCDSWESVHYIHCRKFIKITTMQDWLLKLKTKINRLLSDLLFDNLYELFENEDNFLSDYKELELDGEYVEKWESFTKHKSIKNPFLLLDISQISI